MSITIKHNNLINSLMSIANKSLILHSHAAVLIIGGKPIVWSHNKIIGEENHHAEFAVVKKYMELYGDKKGNLHKQWILTGLN